MKMATKRKYGYYIKGNKIAVIEQSDATSGGNLAVAHCSNAEGDSSSSSDTTSGASEASESSSDDGNESSGSSGGDSSNDS